MIDAKCVEERSESNIKCADGSRFAVFSNKEQREFRKIRIDDCVVKEGLRADWVLERGDEAVILELKGKDVEHAAKQVFATAQLWVAEKR
jgi:hypothetical protein